MILFVSLFAYQLLSYDVIGNDFFFGVNTIRSD